MLDSELFFNRGLQPLRRIEDIPQEEFDDLVAFAGAVQPYFNRFQEYRANALSVDPQSAAHPDKMLEIGSRCRAIRKGCGLDRDSVAEQIGVEPVVLAVFEAGMLPPVDLPKGFADKLSTTLQTALTQQPR